MPEPQICPCCKSEQVKDVRTVDEYAYYQCLSCESIFIASSCLERIDAGENLRKYDSAYWAGEIRSCRERSFGPTLARMAETLYYTRIPVYRFLDIGTGPGYFLDAVGKLLPNSVSIFHGIEKYPPPEEMRTRSPYYRIGDLNDLNTLFQAGICIEVIEHLTPAMLRGLLTGLARVSSPGALYIFNTGMPAYVLQEDIQYLDPVRRGHIISYSIEGLRRVAAGSGFTVFPIFGKTWAFAIEFQSAGTGRENIGERILSPLKHNLNILDDKDMGSVLKLLGQETARAYGWWV